MDCLKINPSYSDRDYNENEFLALYVHEEPLHYFITFKPHELSLLSSMDGLYLVFEFIVCF